MSLLSKMPPSRPQAHEIERQRGQHQMTWVGVLGIGSVLIATGKLVGFEQWIGGWFLALLLSVLMGVYFGSASSAEHVSADTKGDAFYYLGLLFTFGSLVSALVSFSADGGGNDIKNMIAPFGIALLTTIVGLSGRVWFSVWQEGPGDAVADATQGLDEAIVDMKDIVLRGSQGMEDLVDNVGASAKAMEGTALRIASVAEKAAGTIAALDEYSGRVTRLGQSFADGATEFAGAVTGTAAGVSTLKESLEETRGLLDTLGRNLVVLVDTVEQARASVSQLERAGRAGEREVAGIASSAEDVQRDMERIQVGFAKTAELFVDAKHTATTIDDHAARIGSSVGGLTGEVGKLQEAAVTATEAMSRVAPALDKNLSELLHVASQGRTAVASRVEDLEERLDHIGTEAATAAGRASTGVSTLTESLEETKGLLDALGRNLVVLVDTVEQARASVSQLDRAGRAGEREVVGIASSAEGVQRDMERIRTGFAKTAELFVDAKHTATTIDDHAVRIGSSVGGLAGEVGKLQEAAVTAADAMSQVAPTLGKSLSELSDVASRGREAVSSRVGDLEERLDDLGTEAAAAVGRASGRADSVAGDMDKLRDQLTETQKELFQITRDSNLVAKELRRRTRGKRWWESLFGRRGRTR